MTYTGYNTAKLRGVQPTVEQQGHIFTLDWEDFKEPVHGMIKSLVPVFFPCLFRNVLKQ